MQYNKITPEDIFHFATIIGQDFVHTDSEQLNRCAQDQTEDLHFLPEVVLQPCNTNQVSNILKYCDERLLPVTPRGAGTGLSGGALPVFGGVVLDMKRFDKILFIDKRNFQVTTEPSVITQVLQEKVLEEGLFYPPDPASKGSCFIGGNVSENSGGPRAVKYGVVKDYVLNLEIVLADGSIIWTGANVLKNATGYNLTQLIVGSEGTLAVITKIVLRLLPAVKYDVALLVPFRNAVQACEAVNAVFLAGFNPSALEFMERDALLWSIKYTQTQHISIPDDIEAHLIIELDGNEREELEKNAASIADLLTRFNIGEIMYADTHEHKQLLWHLRRKAGEAVKSNSIYKEEDTVVPRAELPVLLQIVKETGRQFGFESVCYGHAGDGNLHVNIIKGTMSEEDWKYKLPEGIKHLFQEVIKLGGTISGEHGIGLVQKQYMEIAFNDVQMKLMREIKRVFDPNQILNPGKII